MKDALVLFGGEAQLPVDDDLLQSLMDTTKTLMGTPVGGPRISIRGGRFREIVGGEQVRTFKGDQLNIIIVAAAPVGRSYFGTAYDPNNPMPPVCWSDNGQTPSAEVPEAKRMSKSCATCRMNVKGSGQGESRACRYHQRLAVLVENDETNTVYQMQIPAASIFGEAAKGRMGLQAYAKLLAAHRTPAAAVVTGVSFDEDSEAPKLFFKPVRPLTKEELQVVLAVKDSPEVEAALTMTVTQMDGVAEGAKPEPEPEAKPAKAAKTAKTVKVRQPVEADDDDSEDEAPAVRTKAEKAAGLRPDLAAIVSEWDDD